MEWSHAGVSAAAAVVVAEAATAEADGKDDAPPQLPPLDVGDDAGVAEKGALAKTDDEGDKVLVPSCTPRM